MLVLEATILIAPPTLLMLGLWLWQRRSGMAAVGDAGWSLSMMWMVLTVGYFAEGTLTRRMLITAVGATWAARLSWHIFNDRVRSGKPDRRYAGLLTGWGVHAQRNLLFWFLGQVPFAGLFTMAIYAAQHSGHVALSPLDMIALVIALASIMGESIADAQLKEFRAIESNCKSCCRRGLWKYSRHPNYFFEWTHWLAYPLLAWNSPYFLFSLIAPLLMLGMLFKVSGIPLTEKYALEGNRGEAYREYQRTTSVFVPWFPKA